MRVPCGIILVFGIFGLGNCQGIQRECSYKGLCQREILVHEPCDQFPPCRNLTVTVPCLKTEPCNSQFDPWSPCDATCGIGTRTRFGRCCGPYCTRIVTETESCDTGIPCTVDGNWAPWMSWVETPCTASCCGGTFSRTRTRTCTNPPPDIGGMFCEGDSEETQDNVACNEQDCPVMCPGDEDFISGPCGFCTDRYFECTASTPGGDLDTENLLNCTVGLVFWQQIDACVVPAICAPPSPPSLADLE